MGLRLGLGLGLRPRLQGFWSSLLPLIEIVDIDSWFLG